MQFHHDLKIDYDDVIDMHMFARMHPRRMALQNILPDDVSTSTIDINYFQHLFVVLKRGCIHV